MSWKSLELKPPFDAHLSGQAATLFALTDFYFGSPLYQDRFIWEFPYPSEKRPGLQCNATGYWGARHEMIEVDGKFYLRAFAPQPRQKG